MEERTPHETAKAVAKTIATINKVINAVPVMRNYDWFNYSEFTNSGLDKLISDVCKDNNVPESHIRTVAGWNKEEEPKIQK